MLATRNIELVACIGIWGIVTMTPEGNLDDPADGKEDGECESIDRVELCEEEIDRIDGGVNEAEEWETTGVEEKPAVQSVSREWHGARGSSEWNEGLKTDLCNTETIRQDFWSNTHAVAQCLAWEYSNLF